METLTPDSYFDENGKLVMGAKINRTWTLRQEFVDLIKDWHPKLKYDASKCQKWLSHSKS